MNLRKINGKIIYKVQFQYNNLYFLFFFYYKLYKNLLIKILIKNKKIILLKKKVILNIQIIQANKSIMMLFIFIKVK